MRQCDSACRGLKSEKQPYLSSSILGGALRRGQLSSTFSVFGEVRFSTAVAEIVCAHGVMVCGSSDSRINPLVVGACAGSGVHCMGGRRRRKLLSGLGG